MDDGADILADTAPAPQVAPAAVVPAVTPAVVNTTVPVPAPVKTSTPAPVKQVAASVVTAAAPVSVAEAALPTRETDQTLESGEVKSTPPAAAPTVGLSAAEEALLKRAARFGIQPVPAVIAKVEESKKNVRAERFGLSVAKADNNASAQQKGNNKNNNGHDRKKGNNQAKNAQAVLADPEEAARLAKRAERFGIVSETLKEVKKVQEKSEEVRFALSVVPI